MPPALALAQKKLTLTEDELFGIGYQARLELARRAAREKRILDWGALVFPEKFNLPFCRFHHYQVATRYEPFTGTEAPRGHAKTTVECFLIPTFQGLEEPELYRHYLNVQATGLKALAVNVSIREEYETNQMLFDLYGDQVGKRKWTDQQFVTRKGVVYTGIGAGQSIRGINYRNTRPDYLLIDDLYDEEDINNPESTLKKNRWFWGSLYPARAKNRDSVVHLQGTAINLEDLLEKLKKQKRWKCETFKAMEDNGDILWKEMNTKESLEKDKEDMGTVIFLREMQNERREDTTAIIKRAWLDYYTPETFPKLNNDFFVTAVLLCVDPSIGKKATENDATGIALILETQHVDAETGKDYWIENIWNEHLSLNERIKLLIDIQNSRPKDQGITKCRIESIAGFKDFTAEVVRRTNLPVEEIDVVKDKTTNRENKSHFFENKKVHINSNIDPVLLDILVHQLTTNHPRHDDLCDAVLLGLDSDSGLWRFV